MLTYTCAQSTYFHKITNVLHHNQPILSTITALLFDYEKTAKNPSTFLFFHIHAFILGIVGTKEYRKPEWVTHMEELQEALKGKDESSLVCLLHGSVASFTQGSVKSQESTGKQLLTKQFNEPNADNDSSHVISNHADSPFHQAFFMENKLQQSSLENEHTYKTRNRNTKECSLTRYLNLRRHSIGSLMEFADESGDIEFRNFKYHSIPNLLNNRHPLYIGGTLQSSEYIYSDSFGLSPIQEYSEPSTQSGSFKEANVISKRITSDLSLLSYSCDVLPSKFEDNTAVSIKCQTFPRSRTDNNINTLEHTTHYFGETLRFPLAPREIDPFAYYQLHTADSQEELQEFLLLESACMSDNKGAGLASAFCTSKKNCN